MIKSIIYINSKVRSYFSSRIQRNWWHWCSCWHGCPIMWIIRGGGIEVEVISAIRKRYNFPVHYFSTLIYAITGTKHDQIHLHFCSDCILYKYIIYMWQTGGYTQGAISGVSHGYEHALLVRRRSASLQNIKIFYTFCIQGNIRPRLFSRLSPSLSVCELKTGQILSHK